MAAVSVRNRIAAILLQSDNSLTVRQIYDCWPAKHQPTIQQINQLVLTKPEFVLTGASSITGFKVNCWTHIDHSSLNPSEEE